MPRRLQRRVAVSVGCEDCGAHRQVVQQAQARVPEASADEIAEAWFERAAETLAQVAQGRAEAGAGGAAGRAASMEEARKRLATLATSSDKVGVSFAGGALQERYFATKFARRGQLLYQIFRNLDVNIPHGHVRVASFGGGPGTDLSGLVPLQRSQFPSTTFECVLYDKESTWKRYLKTLQDVFGPRVTVDFAQCDVTQGLADAANQKVSVKDLDIMIFFYVCHETSAKTQESGHIFYRNLATSAKKGCVIVIADVMKHSECTIGAVVAAMKSIRKLTDLRIRTTCAAHVVALQVC